MSHDISLYDQCCYRKMIEDYKKEGKIVPTEVTVKMLQQAMQGSTTKNLSLMVFLIMKKTVQHSKYCRSIAMVLLSNFEPLCHILCYIFFNFRVLFHFQQVKVEPDFVLFFNCSQKELTRRILNRNQVGYFPSVFVCNLHV